MDWWGPVAAAAAVVASVIAVLARLDSKASAAAAKVSADAAGGSLELARLEARRLTERTDVQWRRDEDRSGLVILRNVGSTAAYAVSVVLTVNDQRFDLKFGDVPADRTVEHDVREVIDEIAIKNSRALAAMRSTGTYYGGPTQVKISARISWQSELGTPAIQMLG